MRLKWNSKESQLDRFNMNLFKKNYRLMAKVSLVALLLTGLTFNLGFAEEPDTQGAIKKIYHVYANNDYIGAVSNLDGVNDIVQKREKQAATQYSALGLAVKAGANINVIPEQVFETETNDTETLQKLASSILVETDAFAILIDNNPVAYLKDQQDYEEAIHLTKLQFVTEKQLNQWINRQSKNKETPLPELAKGEERIIDISIEQKISGKTSKVSPDKVLTPKEAVKLLMTGAVEQQKYVVKSGDVLGSIAHSHELKVSELLALNSDITEETVLQIGQEINVTVAKPLINVNVVKEKKVIEVIANEKIVKENPGLLKGENVVKQEGSTGKKEAMYQLVEKNGQKVDKKLLEETVLAEPVDQIVVVGTKVVSSHGTGDFAWPAVGGYISSQMGNRWGEFHRGLDIARPSNYNILAADNGVVVAAGYDGSYGNKIVINHNNGYTTLYGHLSQINVSVGQVVQQGTVIGIMGSTGVSTGTHLHFEVEQNGTLVNPLTVLK